jgi:phenylpropionate dioxygenase-like ring-hydroxylating dioxygenase large terminal subunit
MPFLKNSWYVAAWSSEVQGPTHQKIIGEDVLLYRGEHGQVIALGDTCPHRFAPLHLGKVIGDLIQCPYHGLQFNADGHCAHNPFDPAVQPAAAKVRSFPTIERDRFIWIWMAKRIATQ